MLSPASLGSSCEDGQALKEILSPVRFFFPLSILVLVCLCTKVAYFFVFVQNVDTSAAWIVGDRVHLEEEVRERRVFSFFARKEIDHLSSEREDLQCHLEQADWFIHTLEANLNSFHEELCELHTELLHVQSLHTSDNFALHAAEMEKAATRVEVLRLKEALEFSQWS